MFSDRHGNLTDDHNLMIQEHSSFDDCPVGDRDIMNDERDMAFGRPKCGGVYRNEYGEIEGCEGCKHCLPPDPEEKPTGFGIEKYEDPAWKLAQEAMWAEIDKRPDGKYTSAWVENWGMYAGKHLKGKYPTNADHVFREMCWKFWSKQSARRRRHSEIVWNRICDTCETHPKAVEAYREWAKRAVTIRYRDE